MLLPNRSESRRRGLSGTIGPETPGMAASPSTTTSIPPPQVSFDGLLSLILPDTSQNGSHSCSGYSSGHFLAYTAFERENHNDWDKDCQPKVLNESETNTFA